LFGARAPDDRRIFKFGFKEYDCKVPGDLDIGNDDEHICGTIRKNKIQDTTYHFA